MKSSRGEGWSSSPPAAAAVPPAARGSHPRRPRAATAGAGGGAEKGRLPEVAGTELTQVTGGDSRVPVARLTRLGAVAGCLPSGSSGQALPGAEHGAGRRRAAKAALEPAPLRARCLCVCACAWQRLGYGNSRGSSSRPRDSAAPEANGRGLLSAPRPLAPGLRRTKGGREGRGRRADGGRRLPCLLPSVAAPVPSWGRASPPGGAEFPLSGGAACAPAFCRGPHPAPLPQAGSSPGRGVSAAGRPA